MTERCEKRGCLSHFECFCATLKVTEKERHRLAMMLAVFRAQRTYEELKHVAV